jgi:2-amino-4-hydroxy-6-hydroxymethyldihydropteridine diphosphokinase
VEPRAVKALRPVWRSAYVALGSNLGLPRERVLEAFERLCGLPDTRLELRSRLYLSSPMGPRDQPDYVNAAAGLLTRLPPHELLEALLEIERAMGRIRQERWGPRIVDLDLLWMPPRPLAGPHLTLPHPGLPERNFVLYPLADIAPSLLIPGLGGVAELKVRVGGAGISVLEGEE